MLPPNDHTSINITALFSVLLSPVSDIVWCICLLFCLCKTFVGDSFVLEKAYQWQLYDLQHSSSLDCADILCFNLLHSDLHDSASHFAILLIYPAPVFLYCFSLFCSSPFSSAPLIFLHFCVFSPADLTELQVAVSDVNGRYEALGVELRERLGRQQASLELRRKARQGTEELSSWLREREHSLELGQAASPSKPEVVRAQAQENKVRPGCFYPYKGGGGGGSGKFRNLISRCLHVSIVKIHSVHCVYYSLGLSQKPKI